MNNHDVFMEYARPGKCRTMKNIANEQDVQEDLK